MSAHHPLVVFSVAFLVALLMALLFWTATGLRQELNQVQAQLKHHIIMTGGESAEMSTPRNSNHGDLEPRLADAPRVPPRATKQLQSNWDVAGRKLYDDRVVHLNEVGYRNTTIYPPGLTAPFAVSNDECSNRGFWRKLSAGGWERMTFHIFNKYINPGKTTVVDFGTWIGPTMLYHGQYSLRSFGIEADPVAYAVMRHNIELNRKYNSSWGNRVTVDAGCVSRPADVGRLTMRAGTAGASMSGIGNKVYKSRPVMTSWQVQCYTLPDIFENYWGIQKPYRDVFIKIDIESYECKLVPSFYDWLKEETFLPKMYISFHPQIEYCTDDELEGVLKFLKLYEHVRVQSDSKDLLIEHATVEDLKKYKSDFVVYQAHHVHQLSSSD